MLLSAGDLDMTFETDGYVLASSPSSKTSTPADVAYAVKIQPADGKILAAGQGTLNGAAAFEVVRMRVDGSMDSSFGNGGRALPLTGGGAYDMALQTDGKIILAGSVAVTSGSGKSATTQWDIALVRLLGNNGALDTSFGPNHDGKVITGISISGTKADGAYTVALQADGKILVGGYTYANSTTGIDSVLLRYNADGSLDTSFGQGGKVVTAWSAGEDNIFDIEIQGDGKIVVAGKGYLDGDTGNHPYFVARYNTNGGLDDGSANDATPGDSFGSAGIVVTPFGGISSGGAGPGHPLVIQPDGAIVFARQSWNGSDTDLALARFLTTGALDPTFGAGTGAVTVNLAGTQRGESVTMQPDGKLVVAGSGAPNDSLVARFQPDGTLDTGFGTGGLVIRPFTSGSRFNDVTVQSDGKIVAVGAARVPVGKVTTDALLLARYQGDPVAPLSASMALSGGTTSAGRSAAAGQPEILVPLKDQDLTQLATEVIISRPKRRRALQL
jgi:uncharacterized delta-60 repeat protein